MCVGGGEGGGMSAGEGGVSGAVAMETRDVGHGAALATSAEGGG